MAETAQPATRRRLLETGAGTRSEAFGAGEWGLLVVIATVWGASFLFIDVALGSFRPGVIAFARIGLGALALGLVPRARARIDVGDRGRIRLLGIIWMGVPLLLFPIAQQWIDSSVAGMINGAMPLLSALWASLLLRRLPGRTQLLGLAVGFTGVVAIFLPELRGSSSTALGAALVLLAVTLYGLSVNLAVPLQQRYGSLPVLWRAQLAALVLVAPVAAWQAPASSWSWSAAAAVVPLGVLGTGLAFVLMATLVGRVGGPRGSVAIYFTPVVALVLGVVVLGEHVAAVAVAGSALVVAGAWVTSRRE